MRVAPALVPRGTSLKRLYPTQPRETLDPPPLKSPAVHAHAAHTRSHNVLDPAQRANQYLPLFNPAHVSVEDSSKRVDGFSPPLYARGVRALELERDILLTATSPDDLIENKFS